MGRIFYRSSLSFIPALFFLFTITQVGGATTVTVPSDERMVVEARAIVIGEVLAVSSSYDEQRDAIFTYTTLRVDEVLKGRVRSREIVIKEPGGEVGGRGSVIFGVPEFTVGEHVLLYLTSWPDGSLA